MTKHSVPLIFLWLVMASLLLRGQTNNPMPAKIKPSGLLFELEEVTTVQASSNTVPFTRINMLREVPDESGRLFVIDLRGFLWQIDGAEQKLFLSISKYFESFIHQPGKGTGFGAFAFHPGFVGNGKFYTPHAEIAGSKNPDYVPTRDL